MMPVNSIASVNVSVTELNSLKTRINELQARVEDQVNLTTMLNELRTRVEAQDQYIKMNQIHSQSLIQDQSSPAQSETLSLRISQSQINISPTQGTQGTYLDQVNLGRSQDPQRDMQGLTQANPSPIIFK